jgi:hypothetical protein
MSGDEERTRWRLVDPQGAITEFEASFFEACDMHQEFACIMAACPDVFGWLLVNLDSSKKYVPEEIEARVLAGLNSTRTPAGTRAIEGVGPSTQKPLVS